MGGGGLGGCRLCGWLGVYHLHNSAISACWVLSVSGLGVCARPCFLSLTRYHCFVPLVVGCNCAQFGLLAEFASAPLHFICGLCVPMQICFGLVGFGVVPLFLFGLELPP